MRITVKLFDSNILVLTKLFDVGSFRVGKSEFSDIVLPDESVSRSALEIRVTEESVYVTNMGGSGLLKIDGKKRETGQLKDGSTIEVSKFKLVIFLSAEELASSNSKQIKPIDAVEKNPENIEEPQPEDYPAAGLFPAPPEAEGNDDQSNEENNDFQGDKYQNQNDEGEQVFEFPDPAIAKQPPSSSFIEGNLALKERTETLAESKPLIAKIMFIAGPRAGEEISLQSFELSFGRSRKADVMLNDDKLSRVHAKIIRFGTGYRVLDLNSRNGTCVNGVRILEHPLSSYDVIEFGSTKIKFLIHDLLLHEVGNATGLIPVQTAGKESTKSLYLDSDERLELSKLRKSSSGSPPVAIEEERDDEFFVEPEPKKRSIVRLVLVIVITIGLVLWWMNLSNGKPKEANPIATTKSATAITDKNNVVPRIPKDFAELTDEMKRKIEGAYINASSVSQRADLTLEDIEKTREDLRRIHQSLPYYKNSRELLEQLDKRYRDKSSQLAAEKAKQDEVQDLNIYLEDGIEYLKQGEFERAAESFQLALNLDPRNLVAAKGFKAAELKVKDLENLPPDSDPEEEKKYLIKQLYEKALTALGNRGYQEAIDLAEQIRKINLKSDQTYLNEAKQIIDRAKIAQKEEFEPFLIQAKEKFAEGDYNATRDLCEEMLKRDPAYEDAKELLLKSKKQLSRLAKEAYIHGYILESIGQIEQAKQYWNRAKNYVRSGDEYFDKVNKKLDQYQ
ncbi:MAG: FHA domain-containing protein [Bdellovibrionales bacterium]|nr:FHA domain-containing protein [Bdellovibrionales bacterium]